MSEENLQAKQEKERLIDLLFPSRKKDEKSLDNNVIKAVNYESKRGESLNSQLYPNKEKTIGIEANEKSLKNIDNPRIMNEVNDDFLQDEIDDNQPRGVVPEGAGDAMAPPAFGRSVNPISTRGTDYAHLITTGTTGFSDLPTALRMYSEYSSGHAGTYFSDQHREL